MKNKAFMQTLSVLMCAAVMGLSFSNAFAFAETADVSVETQTKASEDITMPDEILLLYNGSVVPVTVKGTTTLEKLMVSFLEMNGITENTDCLFLDWVDAGGWRTRLLTLEDSIENEESEDAVTEADAADIVDTEENLTVSDLYKLAKEETDGFILVAFDNSHEIIRLHVKLAEKDAALAVDTINDSPEELYHIQYDANGGVLENQNMVLRGEGEAISYFENSASYENHTFTGWYDAAEDGKEITESTIVTSDMKLYAHWEEDSGETDAVEETEETNVVEETDETDTSEETEETNVVEETDETDTSEETEETDVVEETDETDVSEETEETDAVEETDETDVSEETKETKETNASEETSAVEETNNISDTAKGNKANAAESTSETVAKYSLSVISTTGTTSTVTVKSTVTIAALAEKLGYNVTTFKLKTSTVTEHVIAGTTTMKDIAELAESGEVLIIGYDNNGVALGSAKVTKTAENTYIVTMSKDTNVVLDSEAGKGKGVGETETANTVTQEGKSNETTEIVHTDDSAALPLYGSMGGVMSVLLGVFGLLRKKRL